MDCDPANEPYLISTGDLVSVRIHMGDSMTSEWSEPLHWVICKPSACTCLLEHRLIGSECQFNVIYLKVCPCSTLWEWQPAPMVFYNATNLSC